LDQIDQIIGFMIASCIYIIHYGDERNYGMPGWTPVLKYCKKKWMPPKNDWTPVLKQ
jgi:hypothetical protein